MEISLIRHGKSQLIDNEKIAFEEFKKWVEKYDLYGVNEEPIYPVMTLEKVSTAKLVITSNLKRSVVSAMLLGSKAKPISEPLYRETELPAPPKILFNVKLKPNTWIIILRLLWLSGYSNKCESLRKARVRAKEASQQLMDYANEHKMIVLVGHGFFNMLIAKELKKKGWNSKRKVGAKHWNCTTYSSLN